MLRFFRYFKAASNYNNLLLKKRIRPIPYKFVTNNSISPNLRPTYYALNKHKSINRLLALSILGWLGFVDEDEEKESELIMTLKRAVLATNREEYNKAEQLLHLALRLSQQQQNEQGITYCYDLMANLAFNRHELDKAQKLFVSVLQRILSEGTRQDDLKVIHISLKLARICHLKAEEDKADLGYNWCLETIEKNKTSNDDARMLYGVIQDWYAQFLLDRSEVEKALKHLREAYTVCKELKGTESEQSMLLLNDLGIATWRAGDVESAQSLLTEAITMGNKLEDKSHLGVVHANLGLIYLEKGIIDQAKKCCKEGWQLGKRYDNNESVMQANYCFEQINIGLTK